MLLWPPAMSLQHGKPTRETSTRPSFSSQPLAAPRRPRPGTEMLGQAPLALASGALASGALAGLGCAGDLDEMLTCGLLGTRLGSPA
jgi:hypothetical protein